MAKKDNFLKAQEEFDSGTKDIALWTQALALSNGDEDKAKYKYIELRANYNCRNDRKDDDRWPAK